MVRWWICNTAIQCQQCRKKQRTSVAVHHQHSIGKFISPIPMLGLVYFSARKQRGPLSKRKRVRIYKKVDKICNIPIATYSFVILVLLRWPQRHRLWHVARRIVIMKIQMKVRKCHHLGYVSARTSLRIGTGLEGRIQTYRSAAGQLLQMDMR